MTIPAAYNSMSRYVMRSSINKQVLSAVMF